MPLILLLIGLGVWVSPMLEQAFFGGDMRLFLTDHGIGFDQRNALVVGLAMGFAVILRFSPLQKMQFSQCRSTYRMAH